MSPSRNADTGLSSALVPVGAEASGGDAVRLACELLSPRRGRLYIVHVIEVGMGLPVDAEIAPATAKGEQVLKEMEEVAKPYQCITQAELLQSPARGSGGGTGGRGQTSGRNSTGDALQRAIWLFRSGRDSPVCSGERTLQGHPVAGPDTRHAVVEWRAIVEGWRTARATVTGPRA